MLRKNEGLPGVRGSDTWQCLQAPKEVVEAWLDQDAIEIVVGQTRFLRVLVVDDERDTANSMSALVKVWGHEARVAYNGATALEMAVSYQPDVLLLDIAMPKMDGNQLARKLRHLASNRKLHLIAISGYTDDAHRLVSAMAGFDHYLIKPVELLNLEKLLNGFARKERAAGLIPAGSSSAVPQGLLFPKASIERLPESRSQAWGPDGRGDASPLE
jgi:DNA-binding response OmpR family regulator